ncbi:TolB family protein [Sandaracinus amylolyticus]|uniref:TolB family protein n=1 Tax=Sandaracinus amylolyticus TaxID=927083 RepID=UPI001F43D5CD|nr:hypothetical protein [Sandaracinus amylolyticus]UJR82090.1 Periplasmic component of the Tol biopolymer transport system-like protein [Sandaracinus amylolyticus]
MRTKNAAVCVVALTLVSTIGCGPPDLPESSYYDERIQPLLSTSCVRQNTGCHLGTPEGLSAGSLDLTSYDAAMRRDDLFTAYGPYPLPLLLMKPGDPVQVSVETFDPPDPARPDERFVRVETDIRHAGGSTVDLGTTGFALLQQWTSSGHQRSGVPDETLSESIGPCRHGAGSVVGYDPAAADVDPALFERFRDEVQPVLREACAGSSCHGTTIADLYLSCGEDDEELRWNYWVALQFVTTPVSTSELLRRPLSTLRGGTFHEGGNVFGSVEDPRYEVLRAWAEEVATRQPALLQPWIPEDADEEGFRFFANRVQPVIVRKGCMFLNCHSPAMFHDLRLRGGAGGHFGRLATVRNYRMARELLAPEASTPNESRIIAKNLFPDEQVSGASGLFHRGGSLFEDFGRDGGAPNPADPSDCAGVDADAGDLNTIPAYCVMARWWEIEREGGITRGEIVPDGASAVVWVSRPAGVGRVDDFDTYRPGADLVAADATFAADGALSLGAERSLLASCSGITVASADVRGPAVTWDGSRVAFAVRTSASTPLRLWWVNVDGSGCEPIPGVAASVETANGILVHDFDPAFAPDGRLVFASTRGNLDPSATGRTGPTRAPATMRPNANLYIVDEGGAVRQLTFLLNQELQPALMTDGRLIFSTEKREVEFHQFAGRRQNLDGGDYHPLFAQRESVGFRSATEIVELLDRNLAMVAAPIDAADGAGTIVIVNRSIGPDQDDRDGNDRAYIHSMRFPAPGAFDGGSGVYRSPSPLPSGRLIVSCDLAATDLRAGGFAFELCEIDPDTGAVRTVGGRAGAADVEAVAVYSRLPREIFHSRMDEVNGSTGIVPGATDAEITVMDFPMLATLLFANRRTSRPIVGEIGGFDVLEALAPPDGADTFGDVMGEVVSDDFGMFYRSMRDLGHVDLAPDGSASFRVRGGASIELRVTSRSGAPLAFGEDAIFTGEMHQREHMQFYPGERIRQSIPRARFNELCGGCHGSISGRELDVAADIDVLTEASRHVSAVGEDPVDLSGL